MTASTSINLKSLQKWLLIRSTSTINKIGQVRFGLLHEGFRTIIYKNGKKYVCFMRMPKTAKNTFIVCSPSIIVLF